MINDNKSTPKAIVETEQKLTNEITNENQNPNQNHNIKKESLGPNTKR